MDEQYIIDCFENNLSEKDFKASATTQSIEQLAPFISSLANQRKEINTILELGSGYGGITAILAELLDCNNIHGIDIDEERLAVAEGRGLTVHNVDIESERFPFGDNEVDLLVSFGVFEHLKFYDHPIEESHRVLREGGRFIHSIPNLGSYVNRIALLMGKQPRNVEISTNRAFGISGLYSNQSFLNHIHSPTHDAFIELLEYHGYKIDGVTGLFPYQNRWFVEVIDRITAFRPSLARRIAVLGTKISC